VYEAWNQGKNYLADANMSLLEVAGRLKPGVSLAAARADLAVIAAGVDGQNPGRKTTLLVDTATFMNNPEGRGPVLGVGALILAAVSLVLVIACANLANLLLARAVGRRKEIAVRLAVGASRWRLLRQLLTESLLLSVGGGVLGLLAAWATLHTMVPVLMAQLPDEVHSIALNPNPDIRIVLYSLALAFVTGIGFGLIPAAVVGRTGFTALRDGARGGGGRRQRLRTVLVAVEVAVSVVLLVASGLLIRAVWKVQGVDPGFASERVLTLRTALVSSRSADSVRRTDFYDRVLAGVQTLPGVQAAAYTSGLPMVLTGGIAGAEIPGQEVRNRRDNTVSLRYVTPQFFAALGIPVVQGRGVEEGDRPGRPRVAIVSESFIRELMPNGPPLGKSFRVRGLEPTIVGVVRDIKVRGLERTNEPQLYMAAAQAPSGLGGLYIPKDLVIRASVPGETLLPAVRDVIRRVDPEQPISNVRLLSDVVANQTADRRAQLHILTALAVVALLLTGVGIHGLLAFMVAQRAREIGVRLALGAEPARVARMIVGEAARLALLGGIPGVFVAYAAARAMSALLFGIPPGDPLTLTSGTLLVLVVTLVGALAPAISAVRVSPLLAMRAD
jgi:predicted permease